MGFLSESLKMGLGRCVVTHIICIGMKKIFSWTVVFNKFDWIKYLDSNVHKYLIV